MRSTRPVLLGLAAGGALALSAVVAIPAFAAVSNTPPVANDDAYSTAENDLLSVGAPGVLGNDIDPDGDAFSAALVTGAQHGTVSLASNGGFNYQPNQNYSGPDQFTYRICESFTALRKQALVEAKDATERCAKATVRITVKNVVVVPTPTPTPVPTTTPGPVVVGPATTIPGPTIQGPARVIPGPVIQGPSTLVPGPTVSSGDSFSSTQVPSGSVATGDGSTATVG